MSEDGINPLLYSGGKRYIGLCGIERKANSENLGIYARGGIRSANIQFPTRGEEDA